MHGRPRKPAKPEDELASAARAETLRALQSQFFSNHHNKVHRDGALQLSGRLIEQNPEVYTTWNYRKLVVQQNLDRCSESDPDALKSIIDQELRLVEIALRQNFKSYGAWHHRKWVLNKGHSVLDLPQVQVSYNSCLRNKGSAISYLQICSCIVEPIGRGRVGVY